MSVGLLLGLAALALVDSTSIGTLVIPVFLMLAPTPAMARRVLAYLATVAFFYFAVGVALVLGLLPVVEAAGELLETEAARWAELAAGVGLFAWSFRLDPKRRARRGGADRSGWAHGRVARVSGSYPGVMLLGVTAAGLEVATMLPYLAAIGLLVAADLSPAVWLPTLAGYNLLMVLPALALLGVRIAARDRIQGFLDRLGEWFARHSASAASWTVAIVGFLLARDAAAALHLINW